MQHALLHVNNAYWAVKTLSAIDEEQLKCRFLLQLQTLFQNPPKCVYARIQTTSLLFQLLTCSLLRCINSLALIFVDPPFEVFHTYFNYSFATVGSTRISRIPFVGILKTTPSSALWERSLIIRISV